MKHSSIVSCAILLTLSASAYCEQPDAFMVRTTAKAPEEVVAAIKTYSEQKKWQYLGESKVKKGEVRLVKICMPEIGQLIWPVDLQLSAMLPCGNVGVYQKAGVTEISVLHPRYLYVLYPHTSTQRAGELAHPMLTEMLDAVTR